MLGNDAMPYDLDVVPDWAQFILTRDYFSPRKIKGELSIQPITHLIQKITYLGI